jgi:hypothetical protein
MPRRGAFASALQREEETHLHSTVWQSGELKAVLGTKQQPQTSATSYEPPRTKNQEPRTKKPRTRNQQRTTNNSPTGVD